MTSSNAILSTLLSLASSSSNSFTKMLLRILSSRTNGSNKQLTGTSMKSRSSQAGLTLSESNVPGLLEDLERRLQVLTRIIKALPLPSEDQMDIGGGGPRTSAAQANEIHDKIDGLRPVLMRLTDVFDALPSFDRTDADYTLDKLHSTVNALLVFLQCISEKKPVLEAIFGVRSRTIQDLQRLEMRFDGLFDTIFQKLPTHDHHELIPLENAVVHGFNVAIGDWRTPLPLPVQASAHSTEGTSDSLVAPRSSGGPPATQPDWEISSFSEGKYLDRQSKYRTIARLLHITI